MNNRQTIQQSINFIESNILNELSLKEISSNVSYSTWYVSRMFHKFTDISIQSYIKKRRLSLAAIELRDTKIKIIDIAIKYNYGSQEAFTRAFYDLFKISPNDYRNKKKPIPLFCKVDLIHNQSKKGEYIMNSHKDNVQIRFIKKPARKLYYIQRNDVTNYHEFCNESDAQEIWGKLTSIPDTLSGVVCGWLDENKEDSYMWGIEFAVSFNKSYEWLKSIELPECEYALFIHPSYNEDEHDSVIQSVLDVSEQWNPKSKQYEWATDISPIYENETEEGYMVIKPIKHC